MRVLTPAVFAVAALALAGCGISPKSIMAERPGDFVSGKADAPVVVTEYASASCIHCARFNNEVFPLAKAKYVDNGQVKWVLREILTPPVGVSAAGFMMARCAGKDDKEKSFAVLDAIFHDIERVDTPETSRAALLQIAQSAGMNEAQFDACVNDEKALKELDARVKKNAKDGVEGTPTFFVNGVKLGGKSGGEQTLAQLDAAIAAAKAGKDPAAAAKAAAPKDAQ